MLRGGNICFDLVKVSILRCERGGKRGGRFCLPRPPLGLTSPNTSHPQQIQVSESVRCVGILVLRGKKAFCCATLTDFGVCGAQACAGKWDAWMSGCRDRELLCFLLSASFSAVFSSQRLMNKRPRTSQHYTLHISTQSESASFRYSRLKESHEGCPKRIVKGAL